MIEKIELHAHGEVQGLYSLRVGEISEAGSEVNCYAPVPPFANLITNVGLERMGDNSDWLRRTYVGSGSAAPSVNDTAMGNFVASTETFQENTSGSQSAAPYYTWVRITRRFAAGQAAGNLSEVGIGWADSLFSRALILDAEGSPTTISVGADQFLDVTYEFRFYPKTTDDTGTVTLTGSVGGTYDYIFRSSSVTSNSITQGWTVSSSGTNMGDRGSSSFTSRRAYNGNIGTITGMPNGTTDSINNPVLAYEAGSLRRKFVTGAGLNEANLTGGIRSVFLRMGIGAFQIQFDPPIPKTDQTVLSLEVSHSWGRRA